MAEASMAAFGAAIGVLIAMAVVVFGLRGKGHSRAPDSLYYAVFSSSTNWKAESKQSANGFV